MKIPNIIPQGDFSGKSAMDQMQDMLPGVAKDPIFDVLQPGGGGRDKWDFGGGGAGGNSTTTADDPIPTHDPITPTPHPIDYNGGGNGSGNSGNGSGNGGGMNVKPEPEPNPEPEPQKAGSNTLLWAAVATALYSIFN